MNAELLNSVAEGGQLVLTLGSDSRDFWFPVMAVAALFIIVKGVTSVVRSSSRERSRREIAAYIAEGSMTAEQGERLMRAGEDQEAEE